jgi:ribosomal protein L11 methylase PrmA
MSSLAVETGSFRDPSGRVFRLDNRILRTVTHRAVDDFEFVESTQLIEELSRKGLLLPISRVEVAELSSRESAAIVLEAPKLPFISFPYEWCYSALKAAALCHLDIQIEALAKGVMLSDASAYNVQFRGANPVFIDHLSFRRYREGEIWPGHRQFCEQFLNPLLLRALFGLDFQSWYRGAQEGITASDLRQLLKLRHKFKWAIWLHVIMQASLQKASQNKAVALQREGGTVRGLPREALARILKGLRRQVENLRALNTGETVWQRYASDNSYTTAESDEKRRYIAEFAGKTRPQMLWDLGCNAGDFSKSALEGGAAYVVGFDFDLGALEAAFARARREELPFLPLFMDATNPSPSQGWRQSERQGLQQRGPADALVALAFIHHLAIAKNIPLDQLVEWLTELAPTGVVEFVPKSDPMVQRLLAHREDIFDGYDQETFARLLSRHGRIVDAHTVSASGRTLFWYDRS